MRRLLLLFLVLLVSSAALAQQPAAPPKAPQLTWLRYYTVLPGKEDDFSRQFVEASRPLLERLITDHKVVGWGLAVPLTRTAEPWTHVVYVTVDDWSGVETLVRAIEESRMNNPAPSYTSLVAPGSVRDVVLQHLVQSEPAPPKAKPRYIDVSTYTIKPGRDRDAVGLFREWAVPLFTDAAARGRIGPWGLSSQSLHANDDWTHMVWIFLSDAAALDDLRELGDKLPPMKAAGFDVRLRDMSEPSRHREQLLRLIYMQ